VILFDPKISTKNTTTEEYQKAAPEYKKLNTGNHTGKTYMEKAGKKAGQQQ